LFLINNNLLTNIDGLSSLIYVGGCLCIGSSAVNFSGNYALTNIDGLSNIISIGGVLWVLQNENLSDLCGIKNVLTINGVADHIWIHENLYNPSVEDIIAGNCSQ